MCSSHADVPVVCQMSHDKAFVIAINKGNDLVIKLSLHIGDRSDNCVRVLGYVLGSWEITFKERDARGSNGAV